MRNENLMRIWFAGWNADIEQAREAYRLNIEAEGWTRAAHRLAQRLEADLVKVEEAEDREPSAEPKLCRNGLHTMTVENTANKARCIACKKAYEQREYTKSLNRRKERRRAA